MKWVLTHDSNGMKAGDVYEGKELPLWLAGKVKESQEKTLEVATPKEDADDKKQVRNKK
ncbi:MAG: hypothetical protein [Caudoviricetes sp.]|nr:MAG: hypothetical protein [Caudoviricetes sp.]